METQKLDDMDAMSSWTMHCPSSKSGMTSVKQSQAVRSRLAQNEHYNLDGVSTSQRKREEKGTWKINQKSSKIGLGKEIPHNKWTDEEHDTLM